MPKEGTVALSWNTWRTEMEDGAAGLVSLEDLAGLPYQRVASRPIKIAPTVVASQKRRFLGSVSSAKYGFVPIEV